MLDFLLQLPFSWRQRRAVASRTAMTRECFVAELATDPVEEKAAALLWDKLIEVSVVPELRPYPDDDLLRLYGLADEDLDDDIIVDVFQRIGIPLPPTAIVTNAGHITTPRKIIQLVRLSVDGRCPD
jgi:hypothetical protein